MHDSALSSPRGGSVSPQSDSSSNPAGTEIQSQTSNSSESIDQQSQYLAFARDSEWRTIDDKSFPAQNDRLRPFEVDFYPGDIASAVDRPRSSPPSTPAQPIASHRRFLTTADINTPQSDSFGRRFPIKGPEPVVLGTGHILRSKSGSFGRWYPIKSPTPSVPGPENAPRSISSTYGLQPRLPFEPFRQQLEPLKRSYTLPGLQHHQPSFPTDCGVLVSYRK